jgi:hypothetical protein
MLFYVFFKLSWVNFPRIYWVIGLSHTHHGNMAKTKNAHSTPTKRSCKRSCGRTGVGGKKGRTANAQTRRGLLEANDALTRPESIVSDDDIQAISAGSHDEDEAKVEYDKEPTTPGASGASSPLSPLVTDVTITVPVAMWVSPRRHRRHLFHSM